MNGLREQRYRPGPVNFNPFEDEEDRRFVPVPEAVKTDLPYGPGPVGFDPFEGEEVAPQREVAPEQVRGLKPAKAGYDIGAGVKTLGRALIRTPEEMVSSVLSAIRGGDIDLDKGWSDQFIEDTKKRSDKFVEKHGTDELVGPGITVRDVARLPQQLGYTLTSMLAGLGVGVPTAAIPVPGARPAAWGAGTAASGMTAYRMAKDQFTADLLDLVNEESLKNNNREITEDEWNSIKEKYEDKAKDYGLWEAIPEAIGQAVGLKIIRLPIGKLPIVKYLKIPAIKNRFAKTLATVGSKYGAMQASEQTQETITQYGQAGIEAEVGLREPVPEGRIERLKEAAKEQYPQTTLLTTVTGGMGAIGSKAYDRARREAERPTDEPIDLLDVVESGDKSLLKSIKADAKKGLIAPDQLQEIRDEFSQRYPKSTQELQDLDKLIEAQAQVQPIDLTEVVEEGAIPLEERVSLPKRGIEGPTIIEGAPVVSPEEEMLIKPAEEPYFEKQMKWAEKKVGKPEEEIEQPVIEMGRAYRARPEEEAVIEEEIIPEEAKIPLPELEIKPTVEAKPEEVGKPIPEPTTQEIDQAAKETETEPTEAQIEAGNYKKGHIALYGFDISIENPKGSVRSGVDRQGKEWSQKLKHHYGYIRETVGKDKDHLDVFIGPNPESDKVFVIDQVDPETGKFDEHKIMMGFPTVQQARVGYLANYERAWKGLGDITELTVDEFKEWTEFGDTTKAIKEVREERIPSKEEIEAETEVTALRDIFDSLNENEKAEVRGGLFPPSVTKYNLNREQLAEMIRIAMEKKKAKAEERPSLGEKAAKALKERVEREREKKAEEPPVIDVIESPRLEWESFLKRLSDEDTKLVTHLIPKETPANVKAQIAFIKKELTKPPKEPIIKEKEVEEGAEEKPGILRRPGEEPLEGAAPEYVPEVEGERPAGERPPARPEEDFGGYDESDIRARPEGVRGLGDGEGEIRPSPERGRPAELGRQHSSGRNYRITDADALEEGGPVAKYDRNIAAINLLKKIEGENRPATPEEQVTLAKYVGWGGLPEAFDLPAHYREEGSYTPKEKRAKDLEDLLTDEEYESARKSTPNAHFTSPLVINHIYDALKWMGVDGGRILEPSMGIGHFFGRMPGDWKTKLIGIELDSISGRIAKLLYPDADVRVQGYEETKLPNNFFDLAVSNVPFGDYKVYDPDYAKLKFFIHDYFFAKSLDKVRPGGLVAFITSSGMMNKKDARIRKYIAERAELIAAIRLPNNAFKKIANTEVTTDIVFLRKLKEGEKAKGAAWLETKSWEIPDGELPINEYFHRYPHMQLGKVVMDKLHYGRAGLESDGRDLGEALKEAIETAIPTGLYEKIKHKATIEPKVADMVPAPEHIKNFAFFEKNKKIFQKKGDEAVAAEIGKGQYGRMKALINLRDKVRETLHNQLENKEELLKSDLKSLNQLYDGFVKNYGFIHESTNVKLFEGDPDRPLLLSLENWDSDKKTATKTDIFRQRTMAKYVPLEKADTAQDALIATIFDRGRIDFAHMSKISGKTQGALKEELKGLIFLDPEKNGWQTAEEYLSGNVRAKLEAAKAAAGIDPKYKGNVEALKKAQPEDKKPSQITARLGANWIPETDIGDFLNHLLKAKDYKPRYIPATSQWVLEKKTYPRVDEILNEQKWGIPDVDALSLITDALNGKIPTVYTWITVEGKDKKVINRQKTILAQAKQQEIKEEFERWIWEETERRDRLAKIYNEKFNNIRLRKYDAQHLPDRLPGMAIGVELRPHQKDNIWRIVQGKNTLLAQVVGSGKTLSMSGAAMELRRLGLAKKPMFVVPKHLLKSWESEFLKFYPAAKILVPEEKSLTPQERAEFMARITTGDWDAVVITHPNMMKLPVSKKVQNDFIRGQIAELEDAIHAEEDLEPAGYGRRPPKSKTVKELEKAKNRLDDKLQNLLEGGEKDTGVTFEELGVDYMFIDESHNFKNLWFNTRMTRVAGVQSSDVEKTTDLFLKSRYLTKLNNGRGVVFATGTPISNSMAEMYTIQRYLDMDALKELDIHNFDAWAATFGEITAELEVTPTGAGFRVHTRFRNFVNVDQLSTLFRDFADVLHSEDLPHLPVPKVKDGKSKTVKADISPEQKEYVKDLEARMERIRSGAVDPSEDNALVVTGDGTKAALDMRLINPALADNPGSKVNLMVDNALDIYKSTTKDKSTQLIFCDFSTPKKGVFNVYHDVRDKLIKAGVPKEEIAFIHDYPKDEQKMMLFQKVRQGDIRILMGSSKKMGEGMNVQNRIVAVHHLDAPWTPASVEQRDGRAIRPGNENEEVGIYRYVTQSTFDAYRWQLLENKAKFIGQAMKGGLDTVEDIGKTVIDYATAKAIAADNPIVMEKVKVESDLRKYQAMHQGWRDQRYSSQRNIETQEYYQSASQQRIEKIKADLKSRESKPEDKDFSISFQAVEEPGIKQGIYTDKKQAGQILVKIFDTPFERLLKNRVDTVDLFSYRGFAFDFSQTAGFEKGDIRNRIYFGKSVVRIELNSPDTYASKETAASAYFTTINNAIDGLEQDLKAEQHSLAQTKKKAEDLTQWLKENPDFEHMDKLKELQKRVDDINAELRRTDRVVTPGQYYISEPTGSPGEAEYIRVEGEKIEIMPWVNTFIHKLDDDTWAISEATTGLKITGRHLTREKAEDAARDILSRQGPEKLKELVGEHIEKHGPSPWVPEGEGLVKSITDTLKDERGSISFERINKDHPAVFDNLVTIGKDVITEGHTKYSDFAKQMRDKFSEIWDKIRNIMMRVWRAATAKLKEETGAIYYKETKVKPEDRQWAKDYLDKLTKETDKEKVIARGKQQEETLKEIPEEEDRPKEASPYEKEEDDWFGNKDWAQQVHTVEASKIQDAIKTILNKNRYDKDAQNIDQAIHIYLDIKRNPGHVDEYYDELTDDQKKIVDLAATIEDSPGLMKVAEYISEQYEKVGQIAKSQNVIFNILDNYVARAWKIPKKLSTDVMQKFKTTSRHAKHRVFETILEGQAKGFELEVTGASNNLELLKDEISRTIEDKRLISTLRKTEWKDTGNPIIIHKQIKGYEEIKHPNFTYWVPEARIKHGDTKVYGPKFRVQTNWGAIKEGNARATKLFDSEEAAKLWLKDRDDADKFRIEKREYLWRREPLYAPEEIAKRLNKILGVSKLKGLGPIDTITKYNAVFKSTILMTSLFHHQAFIRSYLLGTRHKTLAEWNPFKMYKEGLKAVNELRPEIELLVRNGLTLGKMQDWEESILRSEANIFGKVLDKTEYTKAFKEWANDLRERQAKWLFQNFGAGLKAQAALIEYRNMMKEQPDLEPNERAKMVAELINDDFGGLHLKRMGRDPTINHIYRLLLLAPDWTFSNVNTMWKAFRSGDAAKTHLYRRFWASVMTKGLTAMIVANILLSFTDEDDLIERFKKAWKAGHFRWLDIDVTPIYKLLGGKSEARKYFSVFGHFRDPMKFMFHWLTAAKHKGSVFFRMFFEALTGTDWKGHRFTSLDELLGYDDKGLYLTETKEHKIGEPKGGRIRGEVVTRRYGKKGAIGWSQIPSYMIHQLRAVTPVQVQNFLGYLQGEIEGFDAIGRSIGAHVGSTYPTERKITEDFVNQWIEIKRARGSFKDLKRRVNEYNERQLLRGEKGIPVSWSTIGKKGINIIKAERVAEKRKAVNY